MGCWYKRLGWEMTEGCCGLLGRFGSLDLRRCRRCGGIVTRGFPVSFARGWFFDRSRAAGAGGFIARAEGLCVRMLPGGAPLHHPRHARILWRVSFCAERLAFRWRDRFVR